MNWIQSASTVRWQIQPFINGRYRPSTSTETFFTINPATERRLCEAAAGTPEDVAEAIQVARKRFNEGCWSELPAARRANVLLKFADLILAHKEELALLDALEMGKPIREALYDAEEFAPKLLRSWASAIGRLLGESAPMRGGSLSFNTYEPRGVIGAITPWNFPTVNAIYKAGPALAAGNTIVLKPSELAPSSALKLAELALEAGVPEGVFNVVPGLGSTVGAALALHPDVDLLSFTGSTTTGRQIMAHAARSNGKPVLLECGGKSPQIIFDDVTDLDAVADATVRSFLWNQGQVCAAHTRVIVHDHVKEPLLERLISRAEKYQPGDPLCDATTFGPLASAAQRDRVKSYVERGLEAGADAVLKGSIQEEGGCFVSPTIFDRVAPGMLIAREEIFGPVLCVQTFTSEAEAVFLANDTVYGLAATVWTRDSGRGRRLANAVRAGSVTIRTSGKEDEDSGCMLSFEPRKASGFGSEIGLKGLQSYSTLKVVSFVGL